MTASGTFQLVSVKNDGFYTDKARALPLSDEQIGFKFPLNAPAVFNPTYDVKDQLNANITNFLMTNQNERVFNTKFGLPLRKYVFEAMTDQNFETLKMFLKSKCDSIEFCGLKIHRNIQAEIDEGKYEIEHQVSKE